MKQSSSRFRRALVICNGEPPGRKLVHELARRSNVIVAADGGANVARSLGIRPDVIIGDLDSVTRQTVRYFPAAQLLHVPRQDNTDLEKALDFLAEIKVRKAIIVAATGKRLDHTLGNLSIIWNYTSSLDISLVGDSWLAMPLEKKKRLSAKIGTTISLVPFGECAGITLRGLRYRLLNASMKVGEIGVSNVVVKSPFSVDIKRGKMLMIVPSLRNPLTMLD
ncbi:MAG: thiamine diphosphokinase [Bacteroidetes bacterium]|nr:thiamine diphosphokinase [Bacteroidota bacterium]MCW5896834.1 thiamine diphosphokinase [Bacteroidota bacterium]